MLNSQLGPSAQVQSITRTTQTTIPAEHTPASYEPATSPTLVSPGPMTHQKATLVTQSYVVTSMQQQQVSSTLQNGVSPPQKQACQQQSVSPPQGQVSMPQKQVSAHEIQISSPQKQVSLPQKQVNLQQKQVSLPQKQVSQPQKQVSLPENQVSQQQKQVSLLQKQVSPPQKQVSQQPKVFPPVGQVSPPSRQVSPPERQVSPPPKQVSPPRKQVFQQQKAPPSVKPVSPSSKQVPLPPKQDSLPQKQVSPPERQVTSPPKQVSSPDRQVSPPSKQVFSPEGHVSPPPQQVSMQQNLVSQSQKQLSPTQEHDIVAAPQQLADHESQNTSCNQASQMQHPYDVTVVNKSTSDRLRHQAMKELYDESESRYIPENFSSLAVGGMKVCCGAFCYVCTCDCNDCCYQNRPAPQTPYAPNITPPPAQATTTVIVVRRRKLMTPVLLKGREKGINKLTKFIFPLVSDYFRIFWIIAEFLLAIIGLAFSCATFSTGSNASFNEFHLVLSVVSTVLAVLDTIFSLSPLCKKRCKVCQSQETMSDKAAATSSQQPCCLSCCETVSDIVRTLLTETILIPLMLCDIYEFVTGFPDLPNNPTNILGAVLFGIGLLQIVFYVYILRLGILISIVRCILQGFTPKTKDLQEEHHSEVNYIRSLKSSSLRFQVFFFIHITGQMIVQILMLVAIGRRIYLDNQHLYSPTNSDDNFYPSTQFWYMSVAVTILPVCGYFTFFLVANFWAQEFPIAFFLNLVKQLKLPGEGDLFDFTKNAKCVADKQDKVFEFHHGNDLERHYTKLHNTNIITKLINPFKNPIIIIFSLLYTFAMMGFGYCAFNDTLSVLGGWQIYYFVAMGITILANLYTFTIGIIWSFIISTVFAIFLILCITAGGSSNRNRQF